MVMQCSFPVDRTDEGGSDDNDDNNDDDVIDPLILDDNIYRRRRYTPRRPGRRGFHICVAPALVVIVVAIVLAGMGPQTWYRT